MFLLPNAFNVHLGERVRARGEVCDLCAQRGVKEDRCSYVAMCICTNIYTEHVLMLQCVYVQTYTQRTDVLMLQCERGREREREREEE